MFNSKKTNKNVLRIKELEDENENLRQAMKNARRGWYNAEQNAILYENKKLSFEHRFKEAEKSFYKLGANYSEFLSTLEDTNKCLVLKTLLDSIVGYSKKMRVEPVCYKFINPEEVRLIIFYDNDWVLQSDPETKVFIANPDTKLPKQIWDNVTLVVEHSNEDYNIILKLLNGEIIEDYESMLKKSTELLEKARQAEQGAYIPAESSEFSGGDF